MPYTYKSVYKENIVNFISAWHAVYFHFVLSQDLSKHMNYCNVGPFYHWTLRFTCE